jgi:carbamoyl-phosphate synthase small subunit
LDHSIVVLEDGTFFEGNCFGSRRDAEGEVVFNTSMVGYQKALTDPSYRGQILALTYPLAGNYGTGDWMESGRVQAEALVVREHCAEPSHRHGSATLDEFLKEQDVPGVSGVDTRALTRKLRRHGVMNGVVATGDWELGELVQRAKSLRSRDLVMEVSPASVREFHPARERFHVAVLDCGMKADILNNLLAQGARVTAFPADAGARAIRACGPDALVVSSGPGDPADAGYVVKAVRSLLDELPVLGICLGHQILALASGAETYKLKFGHRGANQPVLDHRSGRVLITSQNHGYAVDGGTLGGEWEVTHVNLNDGTVEGMRHRELPVWGLQFHPEAGPGPLDSRHLFREFSEAVQNA